MPLLINKTTDEVLDVRDETLYDENEWLVLSAVWLETNGLPTFDRSLWHYEDGLIVEKVPTAVDLLATAKAAKYAEITSWYDSQLNGGYPTNNGYSLAATVSDQNRFTQDAVLQTQLISLSMANGSDVIGFLAADGSPQGMTITAYILMLAQYGQWCRSKLIRQATLLGQLAAATTIEDVNAIDPNA